MPSLLLAAALLAGAQDIVCPPDQGMLGVPLVRDEDTAIVIFRAVTARLSNAGDFSRYEIKVMESDDRRAWLVFHSLRVPPNVIMRGGGGLQMDIDKCTGAISGVQDQR